MRPQKYTFFRREIGSSFVNIREYENKLLLVKTEETESLVFIKNKNLIKEVQYCVNETFSLCAR